MALPSLTKKHGAPWREDMSSGKAVIGGCGRGTAQSSVRCGDASDGAEKEYGGSGDGIMNGGHCCGIAGGGGGGGGGGSCCCCCEAFGVDIR